MVLEIEQDKLASQAHKAKIICAKSGELLSQEQYQNLMKGQN
jgi:alpha-galactosidase